MISTLDMIEMDRVAIEPFEPMLREGLRALVEREAFCKANFFVELAREFGACGELEDALRCFGRALEKDLSCWEAYVGRAEIVQGLFIMRDEGGSEGGLGSWACADLEKALRCVDSENRSVVFRLLLTAYLLVGRYQEVKDLAAAGLGERLCEPGSDHNDLIYSLGFAELFLGNEDVAMKLFRSLPDEYEAGLFGQAICQLRFDKVGRDARDVIQSGIPERYLGSFEFLSTNGVDGYLGVARSFCVAGAEIGLG